MKKTAILQFAALGLMIASQAHAQALPRVSRDQQLKLTSAQREQIWQELGGYGSHRRTGQVSFSVRIGETLPSNVFWKPLPDNIGDRIVAVMSDDYALANNQVLIVDPASKKILAIVSE